MSKDNALDETNIRVIEAIINYRKRDFERAAAALYDLLDREPENVEARLLLASCLLLAAQFFLAERAFDYVVEHAIEPEVRLQGRRGLESVRRQNQDISSVAQNFAEEAVLLLCKRAIAAQFTI